MKTFKTFVDLFLRLLFASGCAFIVHGLELAWEPLGWIAAGVLLVIFFWPTIPSTCPVCGHDEDECKECARKNSTTRFS